MRTYTKTIILSLSLSIIPLILVTGGVSPGSRALGPTPETPQNRPPGGPPRRPPGPRKNKTHLESGPMKPAKIYIV